MSTEEAVHARNGTTGPQVDPLDRIIEELQSEKAPLAARRSQLEAEIAEILKRESRIDAALSALKVRPKPAAAGTQRRSSSRDSHDWMPSQKTLDDIYAAVATAGEPLTVNQIAERVDVSSSTVKKAIDHLRSEQKIRLAGTAPTQGAPKIYGPMP